MRKQLVLTLAALLGSAILFPAVAQAASYDNNTTPNQGFGLGLGYGDVQGSGSNKNSNGLLALARYRGEAWLVDFDYLFNSGDHVWTLNGDYVFNFDRSGSNSPDSGGYAGIGYTYVNASNNGGSTGGSNDNTDSGVNVMLGYDIDKNWGIEGRYTFLGDDLITGEVIYNFGDTTNNQ